MRAPEKRPDGAAVRSGGPSGGVGRFRQDRRRRGREGRSAVSKLRHGVRGIPEIRPSGLQRMLRGVQDVSDDTFKEDPWFQPAFGENTGADAAGGEKAHRKSAGPAEP